jgi:hypothetical protein
MTAKKKVTKKEVAKKEEKILNKETSTLLTWTFLLTFATIMLGYVFLSIPVLRFLVHMFVLAIVMVTLLEFYGCLIEELREKRKAKGK